MSMPLRITSACTTSRHWRAVNSLTATYVDVVEAKRRADSSQGVGGVCRVVIIGIDRLDDMATGK